MDRRWRMDGFRGWRRVCERSRCNALAVVGVYVLLFASLSFAQPVPAATTTTTATDAVKATIDEVLRVLGNKDLKQPARSEERRQLLEKVVGGRFDYQEMSRRSLGAPWNQLSDKDKQEFVDLFRTLLTNTYADRVETYSGDGVKYLNERTEKEYAEVRTKVLSGKTEIPMDYRLLNKSNDWRVYDVVVDGVSLVNNYRGQFSKILRTSSYPELVDQLRKKSDKLKSP